jgi:hypothetical protein
LGAEHKSTFPDDVDLVNQVGFDVTMNGPCAVRPPVPAKLCSEAAAQAPANITAGAVGENDDDGTLLTNFDSVPGMCVVNVHWHHGAEHLSAGEYDIDMDVHRRRRARLLAGAPAADADATPAPTPPPTAGYECNIRDSVSDEQLKEYNWLYCQDMHVGTTYEVHWPHSDAGNCHGKWDSIENARYQTPFVDGVYCHSTTDSVENTKIGVVGQVFLIVNDEKYYMPDLLHGMNASIATNVAKYTGSTTGPSVNNEMCAAYAPISWHVDRKCHLVSASSFDKMCKEMLAMGMSGDVHPHGSRDLVDPKYVTQ